MEAILFTYLCLVFNTDKQRKEVSLDSSSDKDMDDMPDISDDNRFEISQIQVFNEEVYTNLRKPGMQNSPYGRTLLKFCSAQITLLSTLINKIRLIRSTPEGKEFASMKRNIDNFLENQMRTLAEDFSQLHKLFPNHKDFTVRHRQISSLSKKHAERKQLRDFDKFEKYTFTNEKENIFFYKRSMRYLNEFKQACEDFSPETEQKFKANIDYINEFLSSLKKELFYTSTTDECDETSDVSENMGLFSRLYSKIFA